MSEVKIWLPGRAPGKARPRLGKHGVYMPPAYVVWKNVAIANIVKQGIKPLPVPCFVECRFVNFASSDSDNLTGTILDTFVEAGILGGDSKSYVSGSSGQFYSKRKERGKPKDLGSLILVRPQEIIPLDIEIPVGLCL